jgi:WD40 repeat protein
MSALLLLFAAALQVPPPGENWSLVEALSPDGSLLALAVDDGSLRVIDLRSGKERCRARGLSRSMQGISWSREGGRIATISSMGEFAVLSAHSGEVEATFAPFLGDSSEVCAFIHSVDFVDGDRKLMSRGGGSKARLVDAMTGEVVKQIRYRPKSAMTSSVVSPDGRHFAVGNADGDVAVHLAATGEIEAGVFHTHGHVHSLAFDSPARRLAIGAGDSKVRVLTLDGSAGPLELKHDHRCEILDGPWIGSVCFSPDGKSLLSSTCNDIYEVRCWDLEHSSVLWEHEYQFGTEFPAPATFTRSGDLAVLWDDGIILNAKTGEVLRRLDTRTREWNFSSGGDLAWVCTKGEVRVYDVRVGKLVCDILLAASPSR